MNAPTPLELAARALYVLERGTTLSPEFVARQWDDGHVDRDRYLEQANVALSVFTSSFAGVVTAGRAEAWDEGQEATLRDFNHQGKRMRVTPNPYREANP